MKKLLERGLEVVLVLGMVWLLSGCNMMAGAGKMIEGAGTDIKQMAETYTE